MWTDSRANVRTVVVTAFCYCANSPRNVRLRQNWQRAFSTLLRHECTVYSSKTARWSLFCDVTQLRWVVSYRRFGTTYPLPSSRTKRSSLTAWALKIGPIGCSETSSTTNLPCVRSKKREGLIYTAEEVWNHELWKSCITANSGG